MADEFTRNTFPFRFTVPPASLDPSVPRPGPYLFHGGGMQNPHYPLLSTNAVQFMSAPSLRSTSSTPASSTSSGESSENSPTEGSGNRNRCPNRSDAETRFLLEIWRDSFPISRKRNSGAWDTIAKKLNNILKEQKIRGFRTSVQCKARIKYLQIEYKRVKDHNSRSGNDRETFEYLEEVDEVLGCKPNITPKRVLECGLAADDTSAKTGDGEDSLNAGSSIHKSDEDQLEMEFEKTLKPGHKRAKASKGKKPAANKSKVTSSAETGDLVEFLEKSQTKDHEFFERLAEREAERELKSQKLMFDAVRDIARIFKADT